MKWNIVDPARVAPTPWKNGGGVTRELLAWPAPSDWRVRVSIADVERDGPFSVFAGVQRWFAVLEGEGVRLRVGSCEHVLHSKSAPLQFDGEAPVDCSLVGGATRDFNLMVRAGTGVLERRQGRIEYEAARGTFVGIHSLSAIVVEGVAVPAGRFAWRVCEGSERLEAAGDEMLWMEVR